MRRLLPALLAITSSLAACTTDDPSSAPSLAPAIGKADGTDAADHACKIVLDHAARAGLSSVDGRSLAWEGELVVSPEGEALGTPAVLYGVFGTWYAVPATPVDGAPGRYHFRIEEHTIQTGVSTTTLSRFRLQLAPYIALDGGGRLFDHNRRPGDFDVYDLGIESEWALGGDGTCVLPAPLGALDFGLGWTTRQEGPLVAGGRLHVSYALDRLTTCHGTHNGFPAYDVIAHARFAPGGETAEAGMRVTNSGPSGVLTVSSRPFETTIPAGATSVALYFEHTGLGCRAFDSNFGDDYVFSVDATRPPTLGWLGDVGGSTSRDCAHRDGLPDPTTVDSYVLERACLFVDVDTWAPGLVQHPTWLVGRVDWAIDGGAVTSSKLEDVGADGDDRRLRWTVPRSELTRAPWSTLTYTLRASTDGVTFTALPPRTLVHEAR